MPADRIKIVSSDPNFPDGQVMDQNWFLGRNGDLTRGINAGVVLLEPKECHYCAMLETIRDLDGLRQIWTGLDRFGRAWTDLDGVLIT